MSELKSSCCGADARLHREVDREKTSIYHTEYKDDYTCDKCSKPCEVEASPATPRIPCDFCGKDTDGKLVLRDARIGKKDGSDVVLCPDCLNHYAAGEYGKIKLKSPSEPGQGTNGSHLANVEKKVGDTSKPTVVPPESPARNICKACGFDRNAPREPIVCDSNPLSIASYFEDQCEGCGHKKDGSNIISPAEPCQGVRGHSADASVASVKGLDLPPESSGRETLGKFHQNDDEIVGKVLKDIKNGHGYCGRCGLTLSIDEFPNHNCRTMKDIDKEIWEESLKKRDWELLQELIWKHAFDEIDEDYSKAKGMKYNNLPEPYKTFFFSKIGDMHEEHSKLLEFAIAETRKADDAALIERIEKIIDADFDCRMKFKDLNNFEVCVLDSVRRNIKTELEALEKELKKG